MKYVTLYLHHCKENIPNTKEAGREQEYMKHQGQRLTPPKPSICLDRARHRAVDFCPWIAVSRYKFNPANSFYTLLFLPQLPPLFVHPMPSIHFICRKEMNKHRHIL